MFYRHTRRPTAGHRDWIGGRWTESADLDKRETMRRGRGRCFFAAGANSSPAKTFWAAGGRVVTRARGSRGRTAISRRAFSCICSLSRGALASMCKGCTSPTQLALTRRCHHESRRHSTPRRQKRDRVCPAHRTRSASPSAAPTRPTGDEGSTWMKVRVEWQLLSSLGTGFLI